MELGFFLQYLCAVYYVFLYVYCGKLDPVFHFVLYRVHCVQWKKTILPIKKTQLIIHRGISGKNTHCSQIPLEGFISGHPVDQALVG